jgi:hypothetical protein
LVREYAAPSAYNGRKDYPSAEHCSLVLDFGRTYAFRPDSAASPIQIRSTLDDILRGSLSRVGAMWQRHVVRAVLACRIAG